MALSGMNMAVEGVPFFAPQHRISPGMPKNPSHKVPTLFTPLPIRGKTLKNRIIVAPMCQFSAAHTGSQIGALTPYHVATLGHYALKGAALVFTEATAVQTNGRISPNCPGLWKDEQLAGLKAVADIVHSQGALCGIQLAHAGRKASTVAPTVAERFQLRSMRATQEVGGWPEDVVAPSGGPDFIWDGIPETEGDGGYWTPRELTVDEIHELVRAWAAAARRAVESGVDVIEIHGAHGYLIHQFLSPVTNHRKDSYGGSFEGRTRLLLDIVSAIRGEIPPSMPLFVRISCTDWLEETEIGKRYGSWDVDSTVRVAKVMAGLGVDFLDVSSAGNHPEQRIDFFSSTYQTAIAGRIREELQHAGYTMLVGAVGLITEAGQARDIVETSVRQPEIACSTDIQREAEAAQRLTEDHRLGGPMADAILVARQFLREPEWVLKVAWQLGVDVAWPSQFGRVRFLDA